MYNPKNIKEGQLNKPRSFTAENAAALRGELGLIMPPEHLLSYLSYSKARRRIPYDELYLLDSLYMTEEIPAIEAFKTNDSFMGESFNDLIDKHRTVYGADEPITLDSLASLPDKFISEYTGYISSTRQSQSSSPLSLYCEGCIDSLKLPTFTLGKDTSFGIYKSSDRKISAILDDSYIVALLPKERLSREEYENEAVKALSLLESSGLIYDPFIIGARGILGEIAALGKGADINIEAYPTNPACPTVASALSAFAGYGAFLITRKNRSSLTSALSGSRLYAISCAHLNGEESITVASGKNIIADLDICYLRSVKKYSFHKIISTPTVPDDSALKGAALSSLAGRDSLIQKEHIGAYTDTLRAISYAECDINENYLQNGIFSAILPIFELATKGVDRRNMTISKSLEIASDCDITSAVSTLVALSRAQIELSISGESSGVKYNADKTQLRVFASGKRNLSNLPRDKFTQDGSDIYVLSPQRKDEAIPSFDNTRKLLDYLYAIIKKGVVRSAKVFCKAPLEEAIRSMSTDSITAETRALEGIICPAIYLVVEATEGIGGTHIGRTKASDDAQQMPVYSGGQYFERSGEKTDAPNILLVNFNDDRRDINIIAKTLAKKGAKVKYIKATLERGCLDYLASVVPQTHIILLCGDDELIANALCDIGLQSALARYKENKRLIIAFGEGAISAASDLHYLPAAFMPTVKLSTDTEDADLYSKNMPSAFSYNRIAYRSKLLNQPTLIAGDCENALICANIGGNIYSDGLISSDGLAIGVYSLLCDEIIESALKYYH